MLRIGVNLGDVIIDGDDIYGDGVNVAARLEPLAEPGGICIASIVNESVGNRVDVPFSDGGEVQRQEHRPADPRLALASRARPAALAAGARRPPPGKPASAAPSIAVLPFTNMSGDPEQEYFSDGITEDIITDLSKVGGLLVIARNSSFAYKGKSVDIRHVGRELGVDVGAGRLDPPRRQPRPDHRPADRRRRPAAHLWAERYDRDLTDIFAVQDEVTRQIVDALKVDAHAAARRRGIAESPTQATSRPTTASCAPAS